VPLTFSGTYTQNDGDEVAAGTVTVTHDDGTTGTATLDADGAYSIELDTAGGTVTIVEALTGVPVMTSKTGVTEGVTIDTSRDIGRVGTDQSGASGGGVPCWFMGANLGSVTSGTPTWAANTDGVAAGTDIVVDADTTKLRVVTPGTYDIGFSGVARSAETKRVNAYIVLNDDSVGPAYNVTAPGVLAYFGNSGTQMINCPTFPLVLAAGDTLQVAYFSDGGASDIRNTALWVTRRA
jgi:VCBS repeat-containing protein